MYSEKIEQQIELLKNKGIIFKDEEKAKKVILRENYYNITTDYDDIFLNLKKSTSTKEIYQEETYFEELYAIYELDRELRNLIFDYINILEINIKSYISYVFSEKYGEKDFLKIENFRDGNTIPKRFDKLKEQIENNLERDKKNKNSNVQKFLKENGYLSLDVMTKIFTFGNITTFYSLMKLEDKQKVAQNLNISPYSLEKHLKMLNIVRNICAHGDILFNIRFNINLGAKDYKYHAKLGIPMNNYEYAYGSNDLFAIMIIFKSLLDKDDFDKMFIKIEKMLADVKQELDYSSYQNLLKFMGFPANYGMLNEIN